MRARNLLPLLVMGALPLLGAEPDAEGCKDHPLFTRMAGYRIAHCETKEFDSYEFRTGPGKPVNVEGRRTMIAYVLKEGSAAPGRLQVLRNYENKGHKIVAIDRAAKTVTSDHGVTENYDRLVIATGSTEARDIPIPGRDLDGVHFAMEYLVESNKAVAGDQVPHQIHAEGKHVIVIGGGDTGADCIGTALRQGARSVTSLEILPQPRPERPAEQPWPTYPMIFRVASAHEEGGDRLYAVSTVEFRDDGTGAVRALTVSDVQLRDGRFEPVPDTERELPAQLVLLAMGFLGPQGSGLLEQLGVALDERSNVQRDHMFMSSVPGVFVAGDAGRGQSLIVWAIAEGRAAAHGVDAWLTGLESQLPRPVNPTDRPLTV